MYVPDGVLVGMHTLEGYNRPAKPKTCPHCGKPLVRQTAAGA